MSEPADVRESELRVADSIGRLMEFWGFKRPMGRIWVLLYLSPEPLGAIELAQRLKMSASSVGLTLGELLDWGVVHKTWRPGERRYFFAAETSIFKLVRRVLRERELAIVREVAVAIEAAEKALPQNGRERDQRDEHDELAFKRDRLARLLAIARLGEGLIAALAAGADATPLLRAVSESE